MKIKNNTWFVVLVVTAALIITNTFVFHAVNAFAVVMLVLSPYVMTFALIKGVDIEQKNKNLPGKPLTKKQVGKLYKFIRTDVVLMCTAETETPHRFAGVVVASSNPAYVIGYSSQSFNWHPEYLEEYVGDVVINNNIWKPRVEISNCPG